MLEYIRDGRQNHPILNRKKEHYKIRDHNKRRQTEWKVTLKDTQNVGKGLNKVFKNVVKEILRDLPTWGGSGSEVSHSIPDPRNFAEVTILSYGIKKPWLKVTLEDIKNLINNQNFLVQDP